MRLVAVSFWMLAISMVIGSLALLPAYILSESRLSALNDQYHILQASVASLTSDTSAAPLAALKRKLDVLAKEKAEERLTEALLSILAQRGEGVALASFDYSKAGATATLKLRGMAENREALLAFERALKGDARFSKVDLPVSNLAKEKDIEFDLTLSGAF